jgi:hypothetical protein
LDQKKKGLLEKACGKGNKKWVPRLCKLQDHKLYYYKVENEINVQGVIDFDILTCALEVESIPNGEAKVFRIIILKSEKIFTFRSESNADMKDWVFKIQRQISSSIGHFRDLTKVVIQPKYWKRVRISQDSFKRTAQTGDVILFRTFGCCGTLQRCITCSETGKIIIIKNFQIMLEW